MHPFSSQQFLESPPAVSFQTEQFQQICRYAQCSLDLPSLFFNALSLWDSQEGSDSFHLLFQFRTLCHEWLCLAKEVEKHVPEISLFGEQLSAFCKEEAAVIRELPVTEQSRTDILSDHMRSRLFAMHQQARKQEKDSLRFREKMDDIRRQMENDIQPQAALFREMLDAQPPLILKNQWRQYEVPHCDFLKEDPVISGLIQDLKSAPTEEATTRIWDGLYQTAGSLWSDVQEAFAHVGTLDENLGQISADIRGWNVLWTSAGQYLDSIAKALSAAMDSTRLLSIRSQLEVSAGQWENIVQTTNREVSSCQKTI